MTSTSDRRWLTWMADGILTEVKGHSGVQIIQGTGYDVSDFVNDIANGTIEIKTNIVALSVGNEQLKVGRNVNISKQIEKLIRQVWIVKPVSQIFVSSLLPKPTQETQSQALVMKANEGISTMCKRLTKYGANMVRYMPLHQGFLERWKYKDEKTGVMRVSTRVVQPHRIYFKVGTDVLNSNGIRKYLDDMEQKIRQDTRMEEVSKMKLVQQPGLKIQIENDAYKSAVGKPGSNLRQEAQDSQGSASREKSNEFKRKLCDLKPGPSGRSKKHKEGDKMSGDAKCLGKSVVQMVDKWERLSQGPGVDDIDLELGQDSVVRVNLGDGVEPSQLSPELGEDRG